MLEAARLAEQAYEGPSQCMLLMTPTDVRYLVENIWTGKSALSEEDDLSRLVLCRFEKQRQLTPWCGGQHAAAGVAHMGLADVLMRACVQELLGGGQG
jgi:hypothetical protein